MKTAVVDGNTIKDKDFMAFKAYAAAFYQYLGNYHSFGSMKFKPGIKEEKFRMILMRHPLYLQKTKTMKAFLYKKIINEIYPQIKEELYNTKLPYKQIGYPHEGGTSAYIS